MRTLPWKKKGGSTTDNRPKKSITSVDRSTKRSRTEISSSGSDEDCNHSHKQVRAVNWSREPSTSPPPEPPAESFMEEGLENDDKYRIVEDEFLTVAKSFTVHLHAAEYKRLEKIAKSRNADAISSISRPVVGRMTDTTKRKTEEVTRSKDQRNILEKLVDKKKEDGLSDGSDEETLPFFGTSLYGLMTNPKKREMSLMNISSPTRTTRAAAGFRNPTKMKAVQRPASPTFKHKTGVIDLDPDSTASEDDDDLDGPISAPKFSSSRPNIKEIMDTKPAVMVTASKRAAKPSTLSSSSTPATLDADLSRPAKASVADSSSHPSAAQDRIVRRIAHSKLKKKQEEEDKKKLDIIPTFL
ncbi:hypothetical protein EYC80_001450 [Monilinia laxa]|uniref:Uncharacterized protein n=1 Tax=Monilinia laxa TaxID=61186 RepID=A0A5N6K553_MONLA|nr:hypothetical protein EYC80_001450 [Monilinia laxa]